MSWLLRRARRTVDEQLLKRTLELDAACPLVTATMAEPGQVVTEDRWRCNSVLCAAKGSTISRLSSVRPAGRRSMPGM
jgi:hypothetical protein